MTRRTLGLIAALGLIGTVVAANWAITNIGLVPVGFGLMAPAGVYFAGLAFWLRDVMQDMFGRNVRGRLTVFFVIIIGAEVSLLVADGRIAVASAAAFLLSELADFAVYTPLRERGWARAVIASNAVGLVVDSALFLWLAFGALVFLPGQIVGKAWLTVAVVAIGVTARAVLRNPIRVEGA